MDPCGWQWKSSNLAAMDNTTTGIIFIVQPNEWRSQYFMIKRTLLGLVEPWYHSDQSYTSRKYWRNAKTDTKYNYVNEWKQNNECVTLQCGTIRITTLSFCVTLVVSNHGSGCQALAAIVAITWIVSYGNLIESVASKGTLATVIAHTSTHRPTWGFPCTAVVTNNCSMHRTRPSVTVAGIATGILACARTGTDLSTTDFTASSQRTGAGSNGTYNNSGMNGNDWWLLEIIKAKMDWQNEKHWENIPLAPMQEFEAALVHDPDPTLRGPPSELQQSPGLLHWLSPMADPSAKQAQQPSQLQLLNITKA